MISHTREKDIWQMKQLMLLALQGQKSEAAGVLASLVLTAGFSAPGNCRVGFDEMGTPMFEYAMCFYGGHLATIALERSLDFMDLPMQ